MSIHFEHPAALLLILLAAPMVLLGLRALRGMDTVRKWTSLTLRTLVLVLVIAMLAGPHTVRQHDAVTVIALVDISGSMQRFADLPEVPGVGQRGNIDYLRYWMREANELRRPDDRFGIVAFDGQAMAASAPDRGEYIDDNLDMPMLDGTNIAEAVRLALAMFPGDSARRLALISDGNETIGDAREAARQAAAIRAAGQQGVPIDILPIEYQITGDVQVVRVEAPPNAQPGQTVTVRIVMEATEPARGRLTLRREGEPVDLSPGQAGYSRRVDLPQGQSVHIAQVTLADTPINRFEAVFEPDDPTQDALPENNRAEAFTATPSRGRVLIVSDRAEADHRMARIVDRADLPVTVLPPQRLPGDLIAMQNYDLIVLDNIPAYEIDQHQQDLLARYVDQLGGGLIKIGGEQSFGAGGWMNSRLAEVLPLELDPPRELRQPTAALILVLDKSGSMNRPVAGTRSTQQEIANEGAALAIESLQAETYVGVVTFDHMPEEYIPIQRNTDPAALADRVRGIQAAGGTRIEPALRLGYDMLRTVDVDRKHIVLLTDGISHDPTMDEFIADMADRNVGITTIGVGDAIDREQLQMIADGTGSVFHHVRNPRILPRVLVDSVQDFNRPLLKDVPFQPLVHATGSTLTLDMQAAPQLGGLVVTAPRDEPGVFLEMSHPDGEPLLAHWQVGLGRVAAFTSDFDRRWSGNWVDWPGAQSFWTQLIRTVSRPPVSRETDMIVEVRDDRLHVTLEAADEDEGYIDYLQVDGTVYRPDGRSDAIRLRQTGPGRYEGSTDASKAGSYIVALNPRSGARQLAPVIGGASQPTSEEFRRMRSNRPLMEDIAEITGGRELDLEDPRAVNLFDRSDMPSSMSMMPMWRTLLIWVFVILLLDIACRRIAWDWPLVRSLARQAVARVTPAAARGRLIMARLGELRTVSRQVRHRQNAATGRLRQSRTARSEIPRKPATPTAVPKRPVAPDRNRISAALDAYMDRQSPPPVGTPDGGGKPAAPKKPTTTKPTETAQDGDSKPGDLRRNLLATKRRLRDQIEQDKRNT